MLTKAVFIREMAMLEERYNRDMQEPVLDRYYESLKQLTDADFTRAARYIFDNDDYWPSPKRFIELAHGTTKDAAQPRMGTADRRLHPQQHQPTPQPSRHTRHAPRWRLARNRLRRRPQQTRTTQAPLHRGIRNRRATTPTRPTPKQQPPATLMNIQYADNRLILGDPNTTCSKLRRRQPSSNTQATAKQKSGTHPQPAATTQSTANAASRDLPKSNAIATATVSELERDFQTYVIDLATVNQWRIAHFRKAQTARGRWITPVAADGAGFPDLVLVRDRIIYAELKTNTGKLGPAQIAWGQALTRAGAEYYVWRPRDADEVQAVLTHRLT
jgi:hypothetical protein